MTTVSPSVHRTDSLEMFHTALDWRKLRELARETRRDDPNGRDFSIPRHPRLPPDSIHLHPRGRQNLDGEPVATFDRDRPWVDAPTSPSGEPGDMCPCGHQNGVPLDIHLIDAHAPEDFGLSPLKGWVNDPHGPRYDPEPHVGGR